MLDFDKEILIEIKNRLAGLPSMCRLVIYELIPYCNFRTGTIFLDSLDDLAKKDFFVENAPGRKKEQINNNILRNAFRTIKRAKPDQFIFSTANQRIVIELPFLRELYLKYFGNFQDVAKESARDNSIVKIQADPEESGDFDIEIYGELITDLAAATSQKECVKNNNYLNKNKTNNNKHDSSKACISDSFFPSAETLLRAKTKGFDNADDLAEIQAFIDHNKAIGSQWADFNPIYLRWLENGKDRKARQIKVEKSGSVNNGSSSKTYKKSPKQRVIDAYSNEFDYCERTGRFYAKRTEPFNEKPESQPIKYIDIDSLGPID